MYATNTAMSMCKVKCIIRIQIASRTVEDAHALQKDLDNLQRWKKDWLVEFYLQKWQILHITNKRKVIVVPYNINGHTLEVVETAKYL